MVYIDDFHNVDIQKMACYTCVYEGFILHNMYGAYAPLEGDAAAKYPR